MFTGLEYRFSFKHEVIEILQIIDFYENNFKQKVLLSLKVKSEVMPIFSSPTELGAADGSD